MINPGSSKNSLEVLTSDVEQLNETVYLLQLPPHKRKPEDLDRLYELIKESPFFSDLLSKISKQACISLLKQAKHESCYRTRTVFNYGDVATKFYFILKGSVYIIAPKNKDQPIYRGSQFGQSSRQGQRPARITRKSVIDLDAINPRKSSAKPVEEEDLATPEEITRLYPDHIMLNTLNTGDHFGEIALQLNANRSATAVCRETSHFLTISPSIYNKILNDYYEKTQRELVDFFQAAPLTNDWPIESIVGLIYQTRIEHYKRNQIIYDIGDPCSYMYFVKEGEVELVKEARLDIPDDELVNKTMQTRHPVIFDKTKLMHLNYLWRHQYSQAKKQHNRIALLGKYQNFGTEEFTETTEIRKTRAIVKSPTAEIFIVSYRKFVENKNNPRELCRKLLGIEKSSQKEWRGLFENNLIKNRLASNEGLEKARSKFEQELTDCISLLNHPEEFSSDMNIDIGTAPKKLKIPVNKTPLKLAKSLSPSTSTRRRETSLENCVDIPLPKSPNLPLKGAKKAQFVRSIRPEAKEVKVIFKSNKTVVMDPSMVSVCLDLASHTFQGSKMYQSCQVSQVQTADHSMVKEPESAAQTPGKHLAFLLPRTESLNNSSENSPVNLNKNALSPLNTSKFLTDSRFESKSAASLLGKKLEELVRSRRKIKKPVLDQPFLSLSINSMFMNRSINPDLLDESRTSAKRENSKPQKPAKSKNQSPDANPCYVSGSYLPRTLPPKRTLMVKKSPQRKGLEEKL